MAVWKPAPEDYDRIFNEQNPWHDTGSVPEILAPPKQRPLVNLLTSTVVDMNVDRYQVVLGPRRVGKTTCMYQVVQQLIHTGMDPRRLWWLRLDHPLLIDWSLGDLVSQIVNIASAGPTEPVFLFLDELVYSDRWDLWLKTFHDEKYPIRVIATSSATAALRERRLESGVGRWEEHYLAPYVLTEYLDLINAKLGVVVNDDLRSTIELATTDKPDLPDLSGPRDRLLISGGFPEILLSEATSNHYELMLESQRILRSDAVERAIYKDIPQSFRVDNPTNLERLLYVLAGQMTGLLSPKNICQDLGISQPTFDRYRGYLERAFLVFTLPNYAGREAKIQRRGRKVYFVDAAVRNAALQRGIAPLRDQVEMGALVENMAASHLWSLAQHTAVRLHHWRQANDEVDLIYNHPTRPVAFEIGLSATHSRRGLRTFVNRHPEFLGATYLVASNAAIQSAEGARDGIGSLPLTLFLALVGKQTENALSSSFAAP